MRQPRQDLTTRMGRFRASTALVAALALAGGCQGSATPSPSSASPTPTPAASTAASAPASATPTGSPSTAPSSARWTAAGSTIAWRREPHAVLLSDKRLLLVGPVETDEGPVATTAETWDPATGAWTATGGLPKGRTDFAAVPLSGDRVLVAGGLNADFPQLSYSSAYVYDAAQGTWTKTGLLAAARTGPSAALLPDGRVLVAGGYFYQPDQTGSIDTPVSAIGLAAFRPINGGGSGGGTGQDVDPGVAGAALATAEIFDPVHGTWSGTGPLRYARYDAAAATLADGRVLIVGSADTSEDGGGVLLDARAFTTAEIYDPATGKFTLTGPLPKIDRTALEKQGAAGANPMPDDDGAPGDVGTLVALPGGGAVLIAQTRWWKHVGDLTRSFRFDAASGTWSEIGQTYVFIGEPGPVPLWTPGVPARVGAFAAALPDGHVLVAGGSGPNRFGDGGGNQTLTSAAAQVYDPAANAWSDLPPMPEPRAGGAAVVLADGSVLLVNGNQDTGSNLNQLTSAIRFVP